MDSIFVNQIKTIYKLLKYCGLIGGGKSLYWNFKILSFREAVKLPLFLGKDVHMVRCNKGSITFKDEKLRPGILSIGIENFRYPSKGNTIVNISGELIINGNGKHHFGSNGHLTISKSGKLTIGDNFDVGYGWHFMIINHSTIGKDCMLSWNVLLMDSDGHPIKDKDGNIINKARSFQIGNTVWLGEGACVLKGATIPDGCIIAAKSIVSTYLEKANSIYINNYSMKQDISWDRCLM